MITIRTDDGAIGKALKTTATAVDDSSETLCEIKAQMTVKRPEIDALAGFPAGFAAQFYTEDGAPLANMELRLPKRELTVDGKLWRGEAQHAATLPLKNARADNLRFKLEPLGAVLICRVTWRAIGDEVEEVKDLLGKWCSVDLAFTDPREKQKPLKLEGGGKPPKKKRRAEEQLTIEDGAGDSEAPNRPLRPNEDLPPGVPPIYPGALMTAPRLDERLAALGFDIPNENGRFWYTVSPSELQKITRFVDRREKGEKPNTPAMLKPYKRKGELGAEANADGGSGDRDRRREDQSHRD